MMDDRLTGLADLNQAFKQLNIDLSTKVGTRMVATGAGIIKKEAKSIAQSKGLFKSGALIKNIVTKREKNVPEGTIQYNVGVRHGRTMGNGKKVIKYLARSKRTGRVFTKRVNDPYYWSFLEFGHKTVARDTGQQGGGTTTFDVTYKDGRKRTGRRSYKNASLTGRRKNPTGFVEAKPFLQPALEKGQQAAIDAMAKTLDKELLKANK